MSIMIVNHIWDDDPQWLNMFQWGSKYLIIKQVSFIMKNNWDNMFLDNEYEWLVKHYKI